MEFIVLGDNHRDSDVLEAILRNHPQAKAFIHTGDSEMLPEAMKSFQGVSGNCDNYGLYPMERVVDVEGIRVYIEHGHNLPYGDRVNALVEKAKARSCSVACMGHTHVFIDKVVDGVQVINPGSLHYNRDGTPQSYAQVIIKEGNIQVNRLNASDLR